MAIKYLDEVNKEEVAGKRVLVRFDLNVPLKEVNGEMVIQDSTRIDSALPTLKLLKEYGASKITMMSHLARPKGKKVASMSLAPVADYLARKLGEDVILTESCTDRGIKTLLGLSTTKYVLLENLRFHSEEEAGDQEFARTLSQYADIYVNDAFGAAHRKHASVYQINSFFQRKAYAGLLMKKEITALENILERPKKPFVALIGGAKVSDKIKIIEALLPKIDFLLIGGAMAYPFLASQGHDVGKSLCSADDQKLAKKILRSSTAKKILLPIDHLVGESLESSEAQTTKDVQILEGLIGLDIGPKTLDLYSEKVKSAKTVLWNGPMGLFENETFSKGTYAVAQALADATSRSSDVFTLVGGGDSVNAINRSGLADKVSHVSTGGGASLEFIEKGGLPGIQALKYGI